MAVLTWDVTGNRKFETGVDHGVIYPMNTLGAYPNGIPWSGLVSVAEKPSGAEPNPLYADNIKYLNLVGPEEFAVTIEAYYYPPEFAACDGTLRHATADGVMLGGQSRQKFGLVYRTKIGNDTDGQDHGYKLHLIYGGLAAPSEKTYQTVNESPEAITFSWEVSTIPAMVTGAQPTACITIDSTLADPDALALLEAQLFGTTIVTANLPTPDAVIALMTPVP